MSFSVFSPTTFGSNNTTPKQSEPDPAKTDEPGQSQSTGGSGQTGSASGANGSAPASPTSDTPDSGQQPGNNGSATQSERPTSRQDITVARDTDGLGPQPSAQSIVAVQAEAPVSAGDDVARARAAAQAYQQTYAQTALIETIATPQSAPDITAQSAERGAEKSESLQPRTLDQAA